MKLTGIITLALLMLYACGTKTPSGPEKEKMEYGDTIIPEFDTETTIESIPDGEYYFFGVIDHKYPFHMQFNIDNNTVNGKYFYVSQRKEIELKGEIINQVLSLEEFYKNKTTGSFLSSTLSTDSIAGTWSSPKGKKMDFALYKSTEEDYVSVLKNEPGTWTKSEFIAFQKKFDQPVFPFKYHPLSSEEHADKTITEADIKKFIHPEYNPENDFGLSYVYGITYELPEFIVLVYSENYTPGAFGIYNTSLVMRTYTLDGKFIDEKYLGCNCLDNNYNDYFETSEEFHFVSPGEIKITGTETHASHEWYEEETGEKPFSEETPINRVILLNDNGTFKK